MLMAGHDDDDFFDINDIIPQYVGFSKYSYILIAIHRPLY